MTRHYTPPLRSLSGATRITVKRCCDSCGRELGDATHEELDHAVFGEPLPPVADECGCPRIVEQLAIFLNHRDHAESGTALWEHLDPVGRDAYLRDATATIRALVHLGWGPAPLITDEVLDRAAHAAWASTGPAEANIYRTADAWHTAENNQKNRWRLRAAAAITSTRNRADA